MVFLFLFIWIAMLIMSNQALNEKWIQSKCNMLDKMLVKFNIKIEFELCCALYFLFIYSFVRFKCELISFSSATSFCFRLYIFLWAYFLVYCVFYNKYKWWNHSISHYGVLSVCVCVCVSGIYSIDIRHTSSVYLRCICSAIIIAFELVMQIINNNKEFDFRNVVDRMMVCAKWKRERE